MMSQELSLCHLELVERLHVHRYSATIKHRATSRHTLYLITEQAREICYHMLEEKAKTRRSIASSFASIIPV